MDSKKIKVWAHRGASGYAPENTMDAFRKAIEMKADGIELDVHTSADGELIVMHDENVDRVTDGTGLIKDMTLAQLKELKVSTPAEPSGIYHIPTLAEVLELMRTTDMMINIELKNSICFYPGMEEKILKQLIYSSFNHYSLLQLKQLNDHVQTGILFSDGWVNPAMYAKNLGINAVHHFKVNVVAQLHGAGDQFVAPFGNGFQRHRVFAEAANHHGFSGFDAFGDGNFRLRATEARRCPFPLGTSAPGRPSASGLSRPDCRRRHRLPARRFPVRFPSRRLRRQNLRFRQPR